MYNNEELNYAVYNFNSIKLIKNTNEVDNAPILFIKSIFKKTTSGKGLYNYYENHFYDSNNKLLIDNSFAFHGIQSKVITNDYWGILRNNVSSMLIKVAITDRLGEKKDKIFDMGNNLENRFKNWFDYLILLENFDTHSACEEILRLKLEIEKLQRKLKLIK